MALEPLPLAANRVRITSGGSAKFASLKGSAMTDMLENRKPWFMRGNYGAVADELTELNLKVTGSVPPTLSGMYLRNGSNPKTGETEPQCPVHTPGRADHDDRFTHLCSAMRGSSRR